MKKNLLLLTLVLMLTGFTLVKAQLRCGTDEYMNTLKQQDPGLEARMNDIETKMQRILNEHGSNYRASNAAVTIPCVVHIIWNTAAQNLSYDIIKSQIDVLNEDYGGYNSDVNKTPPFFRGVRAGDTGIRFALATRDPNGNPTNGIVRTYTTSTSLSSGYPTSPAWPAASYLNIWVYNLGGGLLGFAQFPGGSAASDGVNILYSAFGRVSPISAYNYGRTATHEVGHWLNLRHIWGDATCGSDLVSDTPTQSTSNFGCPSCHNFTCNNQPVGDQYMNYMDYVDDKCMYIFTQGQSARMNSAITAFRSGLITSQGLQIVTSPALDAGITEIISPALTPCLNTDVSFIPEVKIKNFGTTALTSAVINYKIDNGTTQLYNWSGSLATGVSANVLLPTQSTTAGADHIFYCWTSGPNGGVDQDTTNNRTSRNFIGHATNAPFPLTQGFELVAFPPTSWTNRNYDCNTGWARTTTAFHSGVASAFFNNFTAPATYNGVMDELVTQPVDMSSAPANAALKFWVAYAGKSSTAFDTLEVFVSTDCGINFTSVYKKWGSSLATAPDNAAAAFVPASSEWREETVSLSSYVGTKNLIFVFRNTNHGGNNLYLDDFNVTTTGLTEINTGVSFNIFPNPSNGILNIQTQFENAQQFEIRISDVTGRILFMTPSLTSRSETVVADLNSAANGVYFVKLITGNGIATRKLILNR